MSNTGYSPVIFPNLRSASYPPVGICGAIALKNLVWIRMVSFAFCDRKQGFKFSRFKRSPVGQEVPFLYYIDVYGLHTTVTPITAEAAIE